MSMLEIKYPKKANTEAEIEGYLWYFLRKQKIDARLQVTYGNKAKLDIVCFKERKAVCIIECKAWSRSYSLVRQYRLNNTRQLIKYREMFGIPVLICGRMSDITKVQDEVLKLYKNL